jgi:hypothetical protein
MTPFLVFRVWLARASPAKKASAVASSVLVLALLVWVAVPPGNVTSAVVSGLAGSTAADAGSAGVSPTSPGTGTPASRASGSSSSPAATALTAVPGELPAPSGPSPIASITGSVPVAGHAVCHGTAPPIKIGVVLISIGIGSLSINSTFGVPNPSQQEADFNAVFDAVNKAGGVICHPLVGDFQSFDELDASTAQSACLQFVQDKVSLILGGFLPQASDTCPLQHHIPVFEEIQIPSAAAHQFFPYYFSASGELEVLLNNFAHAIARMGYFSSSKGFKKLGILYRDCIPGEFQVLVADVEHVGVSAHAISSFDVGCPSGFAAPSTLEQAVLQFQQAGVTAVTPIDGSDLQTFSNRAQQQGFHPQWLLPDDGTVATSAVSTFQPNPANFNGAVAITPEQYGAIAAGLPETSPTKTCDQIMTSHGLPTVYESADQFAGSTCSLTWMADAAIANAPSLSAEELAPGLTQAGAVAFSFPDGPNNFSAPRTTYGGQYWRPITFSTACHCWKVTNPTFQPSF